MESRDLLEIVLVSPTAVLTYHNLLHLQLVILLIDIIHKPVLAQPLFSSAFRRSRIRFLLMLKSLSPTRDALRYSTMLPLPGLNQNSVSSTNCGTKQADVSRHNDISAHVEDAVVKGQVQKTSLEYLHNLQHFFKGE